MRLALLLLVAVQSCESFTLQGAISARRQAADARMQFGTGNYDEEAAKNTLLSPIAGELSYGHIP